MRLLKSLPIVTILVAGFVFLKFGPKIMGWLDQNAKGVAKVVAPETEVSPETVKP